MVNKGIKNVEHTVYDDFVEMLVEYEDYSMDIVEVDFGMRPPEIWAGDGRMLFPTIGDLETFLENALEAVRGHNDD